MNTFVRFIYVYREKSTGRAVYVGSAFDPKQRDEQHCKSTGLPFDRELQRRGRAAFTFHLVEALPAPTAWAAEKAAAARENHWMDVEHTFRTEGCFNFARSKCHRSEEIRDATIAAMSAALKIAKGTPEARAAQSAAMKIARGTPEARARQSAAIKKHYENLEARAAQSAAMKIAKGTPEARAAQSAAQKIAKGTPEARAKNSVAMRKHYENLEARARTSAAIKLALARPEVKARHSVAMRKRYERMKKLYADTEFAAAHIERLKKTNHIRWHVKGWTSKKTGRYHPPKPSPKCELCSAAQHQSENCSKPPSR